MKQAGVYIVAVDGLDGVGKSTFTKELEKLFKRDLRKYHVNVILQHFPVYENETGKQIMDFLHNDADVSDPASFEKMIQLQIDNRTEWWNNIRASLYGKPESTIIIADRYMASNDIYNALPFDNWEERMKEIHSKEIKRTQPQATVQVFCFCDPKLQFERLSRRKTTDKYENFDYLWNINQRYPDYIKRCEFLNSKGTVKIPMHILDKKYTSQNKAPLQLTKDTMEKFAYVIYYAMYLKGFNIPSGLLNNIQPQVQLIESLISYEFGTFLKSLKGGRTYEATGRSG